MNGCSSSWLLFFVRYASACCSAKSHSVAEHASSNSHIVNHKSAPLCLGAKYNPSSTVHRQCPSYPCEWSLAPSRHDKSHGEEPQTCSLDRSLNFQLRQHRAFFCITWLFFLVLSSAAPRSNHMPHLALRLTLSTRKQFRPP